MALIEQSDQPSPEAGKSEQKDSCLSNNENKINTAKQNPLLQLQGRIC